MAMMAMMAMMAVMAMMSLIWFGVMEKFLDLKIVV